MHSEKFEEAASTSINPDVLIRAQQIRTVYGNIPMVLASNVVVPLMLAFALQDVVTRLEIGIWLTLTFVVVAVRAGLLVAYWRRSPPASRAAPWGHYLTVSAFASGCLWGAAGAVLMQSHLPAQFSLIVLILAGLGAGAVVSYAAYLPAFYSYFLPSLLPFVVTALLGHAPLGSAMAIAALIYVGALSFFAHNLHQVFTQSQRLRFENLDLVKALTVEKETAERANAAKTRFLAAASHDLRQPLHAMGLFVSALSERVRSVTTRKLVSQLALSTEALRGLLDSLLDISRLDAGVIQPHITHCCVQALFDKLAHDNAVTASEKNIRLKFVTTRAVVRCDAVLLERIVRNLVANAIRYTERGGVVVGCRGRGAQVCIQVWDSGIGIATHNMDKIFHEFYQIGNPERDRSKGLGLGLAIAQRLARLLNHRIGVASILGKGSVFTLTVPRSTEKQATTELAARVTPGRLPFALVVVIDDELAIREATQTLLLDWGCNPVLADSAETALACLDRRPQVIIADYRLRDGKTGVEVIELIHARYGGDIAAILITGDTAPIRLREAQASGYYLLHKPLAPAQLRALLSHLLVEKSRSASAVT